MRNRTNEIVHVYTLIHFWGWRFYILIFPLLGMGWTVIGLISFLPSWHTSFGESLGTTIAGLIFLLLMVYFYRALGQMRLVVTEDGITYYALGYRMYTPWNNLMEIDHFRPYPFTLLHARTFTGFKLRQKYSIHLKLEEGRRQQIAVLETEWWNPAWSMAPFAEKFPIFEVVVGHNWQERAFGRDVRQYAPWVFH